MNGYITKSLYSEIELLEQVDNLNNGDYSDEERNAIAYELTIAHDNSVETIERYAKATLFADSQINAIDTEIERLKQRKARFQAMQDRVKGYIQDYMEISGQRKIEAGNFSLSLRKSERVVIIDSARIPSEFLKNVVTIAIDKNGIKKAFKLGEVEGCAIEEIDNLQIK